MAHIDLAGLRALPISGDWTAQQITVSREPALTWNTFEEAYADRCWTELLARKPASFNGSLGGLVSGSVSEGSLQLTMRPTSFRAYVASRSPDSLSVISPARRADPLGMTSIVLTADRQVVATRRSLEADQNPGLLYLVGGFVDWSEDANIDLAAQAMREVGEELGIAAVHLHEPRLIGLSYDPVFYHPEASFIVTTALSFKEVVNMVSAAKDRHEHQMVLPIHLQDFLAVSHDKDDRVTWSYMQAQAHARQWFAARC